MGNFTAEEMMQLIENMEDSVRHIQVNACECGQRLKTLDFGFEYVEAHQGGETIAHQLVPRVRVTYRKGVG